MPSNLLIIKENDQRVKNLLEQGKRYEAAKLCFCLETTRDLKVKVIKTFIEGEELSIEGEELSRLGNQTLRSLLLFCRKRENGQRPKIIVFKAKGRQKRIWHYA